MFDKIKALFSGGGSNKSTKNGSSNGSHIGTVKKVLYKKGFGFIDSPDHNAQIFVHFSDTVSKIRTGDQVRFKVKDSDKGPRAVEVEVIQN